MPGVVNTTLSFSSLGPLNSGVPSLSASSATVAPSGRPNSEKVAVNGATPARGVTFSIPAAALGTATTVIVADALPPPGMLATAVITLEPAFKRTAAANPEPARDATAPLTTTPVLPPAPSTMPRTITSNEATVAPSPGAVIVTPAPPTVNSRTAGDGSSLPARSRARTSKRCGP